MEEKIICKSETYNGFFKLMCIIGGICVALYFLICLGTIPYYLIGNGLFPYLIATAIFAGFAIVGYIVNSCFANVQLTISDKRVYGSTFWGKRVDLPIDSVSAVGMGIFKSISIATSSGSISFSGVLNRDEMHESISKLLIDRQGKQTTTTTIKQELPQSNADELKKYKDLLDSGVITQEEFDAKKKQLLGL